MFQRASEHIIFIQKLKNFLGAVPPPALTHHRRLRRLDPRTCGAQPLAPSQNPTYALAEGIRIHLWTFYRGGATVLKVGANYASEASRKFFDPHLLASEGQNIHQIAKSP